MLPFTLTETVATFDQVFEPRSEAGCWSVVDNGMIEAQRQAEIVTCDDLSIHQRRFLGDAAHREIDGVVVDGNAPASAFARQVIMKAVKDNDSPLSAL